MVILALDDERMALEVLKEAIMEASPDCSLHAFRLVDEAISFAKENRIDVAFLDIRMKGHTGLEVAMVLKKLNPKTNIIFATGYSEYQSDAFKLHASGYLLKPITAEAVKEELSNLRFEPERNEVRLENRIIAKTFGNFDFLVDGKPVTFQRTMAKEILAYLVDKRGGAVTRQELSLLLFGDEDYSRKTQDYLSKVITSLIKSLKEVKADCVLVKGHNSYSVDITKFDCDAYLYLNGDPSAINSFYGEYMAQYLWNEECIDKFYKEF